MKKKSFPDLDSADRCKQASLDKSDLFLFFFFLRVYFNDFFISDLFIMYVYNNRRCLLVHKRRNKYTTKVGDILSNGVSEITIF